MKDIDREKLLAGPHVLIALQAQNVKRLEAVSITFGGAAVAQITGRNEQGKSSLLDAFKWALGGSKDIQTQPIRRGADEASVLLDFGKIVVTKTLRATEDGGYRPTLVVQTADGVKLPTPQAVLDAWLGPLTFDPLTLMRAPAKDRVDMIKALVPGYDFAAAEKTNKDDYERRTQVGRDRTREKNAAAAITVEPETPDEPVDVDALLEEHGQASDHNRDLDEIARLDAEIERLQDRRATIGADALKTKWGADRAPIDEIAARGRNARAVNEAVVLKRSKASHEEAAADADRQYDALTEKIDARTREMTEAIEAAKLPVKGLSFSDADALVDGLPFDQASSAKQIEVAVALSMAMNPSLRVIRIRDGALLDDDHMRLIERMAAEAGYLILMERVSPAEGVGMVVEIEGGKIKSLKPADNRAASRRK